MTDPEVPAVPSAAPPAAPPAPPGYAPPPGYGAPGYGAPGSPPPGYGAPGYPPPGAGPIGASGPATSALPRARTLGRVALVAGILALVVSSVLGSIAIWQIGLGADWSTAAATGALDPAAFTPVRGWVLLAEISFWCGTLLGLWALVQGIIAIVRAAGRGAGIAAVVIAAVAPVVSGILVVTLGTLAVAAGMAATLPLT